MTYDITLPEPVPITETVRVFLEEDSDADGTVEAEGHVDFAGTSADTTKTVIASTGSFSGSGQYRLNIIYNPQSDGDVTTAVSQDYVQAVLQAVVAFESGTATATTTVSLTSPETIPTLSGTVTLNGSGVQGAVVYVINDTEQQIEHRVTTDSSGNYSVNVARGETYHITVQYEDGTGTKFTDTASPYVIP